MIPQYVIFTYKNFTSHVPHFGGLLDVAKPKSGVERHSKMNPGVYDLQYKEQLRIKYKLI